MTITTTIAAEGQTTDIAIDKLKLHPRNARKDYDPEGITELANSIRARGVLQNLTVVPDGDDEGKFFVVIGNRRLLAAREAGMESVPCVIREMEDSEQVTTMLTENLQRVALTTTEEASTMQMCLKDYGMDVEGLSKETGLSQTTVRHRLNIAKLDQKTLAEKESDSDFQLNISDLAALEKVKSIRKRNEILANASSSRDLASRALAVCNEEKRAKNEKKYIALADREGVKPLPEESRNELYTNKWETLAEYPLEDAAPRHLIVKDRDGNIVSHSGIYYVVRWRKFEIVRKAKRVKKVLTETEKKEREVRKVRRQHKAIYRDMLAGMGDFYKGIADGKIKDLRKKGVSDFMRALWGVMMEKATDVSCHNVALALSQGDYWSRPEEERKALAEQAETLPLHLQMMGCVFQGIKGMELMDSDGHYFAFGAGIFREVYDCFAMFGFGFNDPEKAAIMDGTHDLYIPREPANMTPDADTKADDSVGNDADAYCGVDDDTRECSGADIDAVGGVNDEANNDEHGTEPENGVLAVEDVEKAAIADTTDTSSEGQDGREPSDAESVDDGSGSNDGGQADGHPSVVLADILAGLKKDVA